MSTAPDVPDLIERVVIHGDLKGLSPAERTQYYAAVCKSLGLNPLTRPFDYILLNGKLTLYAKRDATEQLRRVHGVSIERLEREVTEGIYTVTAYAVDASGRKDSSLGAVAIDNLKGEARANAMMKAETKSKRRVTLSICGLGLLDETEVETIPHAVVDGPQVELAPDRGESEPKEAPPPSQGAGSDSPPSEESIPFESEEEVKERLASPPKITPAQVRKIKAMQRTLVDAGALSDEAMQRALGEHYGTPHVHELTLAQASDLIDRLEEFARKAGADEGEHHGPVEVTR